MQSEFSNRQPANGRRPHRLVSFGLPVLFLLAFFGAQFVNFDTVGWSSGFDHPWEGWDHLVTMLAVGIWAAQLRGQAIWMLPLAFVGVMGLGGVAGAEGFSIPHVEGIILLSCGVFGVLITRKVRFSTKVNVLIVAFFAFFHGFAHGHEISTSASLISYVLGFMLATLLLHGAGILVAKLVVFAVTCLLTVLFSHAALAKTADSQIEAKIKSPETGLVQTTPEGWSAGYLNTGFTITDNFSGSERVFGPGGGPGGHDVSVGQMNSGDHADVGKSFLLKSDNDKPKANGDNNGLISSRVSYPVLHAWQYYELSDDDFTNHSGLSFKRCFPDINHTPGIQLLANGVGLTSPPVAISDVLASQAPPLFCKTSISFIEESLLQSNTVKFGAGNPFLEIPANGMRDCAARDRCRAQPADTFFNSPMGTLSHLHVLVSRLHFSFEVSKNWPSSLSAIWPRHAIKNNNYTTRRKNCESTSLA